MQQNNGNPMGAQQMMGGFGAPQQGNPQGYQGVYQQQQQQVSPQQQMMREGAANIHAMMAGFDTATIGGGGAYLEDGTHFLQIVEVKNGQAPQGGFPFFVVVFKVLASDNPTHKVGSQREWMVAFKNMNWLSTYQADVKQFLLAAWQSKDPTVHEGQIDMNTWALSADPNQQPLAGVTIAAHCFQKNKKNSTETFTKTNFSPWRPNDQEMAAVNAQQQQNLAQQNQQPQMTQQQPPVVPQQQMMQQQVPTVPMQQPVYDPNQQQSQVGQQAPQMPGGQQFQQQPNNGYQQG